MTCPESYWHEEFCNNDEDVLKMCEYLLTEIVEDFAYMRTEAKEDHEWKTNAVNEAMFFLEQVLDALSVMDYKLYHGEAEVVEQDKSIGGEQHEKENQEEHTTTEQRQV